MKRKFDKVYQFKITLEDINPAIWRRIQVPENYSFWDLHIAIQDSMGWSDCHLHEFEIGEPTTGKMVRIVFPDGEAESYHGEKIIEEHKVKIAEWFSLENKTAKYIYDFGDGWEHLIELENIFPREKNIKYPICLDGKRACPPEDCGGSYGYKEFVIAIKHPNHKRHKELLEWYGGQFDPESFNPKDVIFSDPGERWQNTIRDR